MLKKLLALLLLGLIFNICYSCAHRDDTKPDPWVPPAVVESQIIE